MTVPTSLNPSTPSFPAPVVLHAFSRVYEAGITTSYLDEIHIWHQRAKVSPTEWIIEPVGTEYGQVGFYAIPKLPDQRGYEYRHCVGRALTQEKARQAATRSLSQIGINVTAAHVRWRFSQFTSPSGTMHDALPIVYGPPVLLDDDRTIGYGPTHQEAKENSARKLFQLGYCWI